MKLGSTAERRASLPMGRLLTCPHIHRCQEPSLISKTSHKRQEYFDMSFVVNFFSKHTNKRVRPPLPNVHVSLPAQSRSSHTTQSHGRRRHNHSLIEISLANTNFMVQAKAFGFVEVLRRCGNIARLRILPRWPLLYNPCLLPLIGAYNIKGKHNELIPRDSC